MLKKLVKQNLNATKDKTSKVKSSVNGLLKGTNH